MSHLYFIEQLDIETFRPGSEVNLTGTEAHHAIRVSRLRVGEQILIGNGRGVLADARITDVAAKTLTCVVDVVRESSPQNPKLVLVQSLAKGDRDERAVEAATEVGVDAVYPYQAARSISRWQGDKVSTGVERWQKLAREASKQSLRPWIPVVEPVTSLDALAASAREHVVLVLHPTGEQQLSEVDPDRLRAASEVFVVIGPEGGFDEVELSTLRSAGAEVVRLGENVVRTSTAGVAALSVLNVMLNRW